MSKRFTETISIETVYDNKTGEEFHPVILPEELLDKLNDLADQIVHLENEVYLEQGNGEYYKQLFEEKCKENEVLERQLHLIHMASMFSTVRSFKGDVSKRYRYSEETDEIYDSANHYGQYYQILDKKEIVMLLNEYETVLKDLGDTNDL